MDWRRAHGWPIGLGLEEEIEQELCKKHPNECTHVDASMPEPGKRHSWRDVLTGTKVMIRDVLSGRKRVTQEEAYRRADICVKCNWNQDISWPCGGSCGELKDFVENVLQTPTNTPYEGRLKSCGVCSCYNSAAIWLPLDVQQSALTEEQKSKFRTARETMNCWKGANL
jgi:hypothetical protein